GVRPGAGRARGARRAAPAGDGLDPGATGLGAAEPLALHRHAGGTARGRGRRTAATASPGGGRRHPGPRLPAVAGEPAVRALADAVAAGPGADVRPGGTAVGVGAGDVVAAGRNALAGRDARHQPGAVARVLGDRAVRGRRRVRPLPFPAGADRGLGHRAGSASPARAPGLRRGRRAGSRCPGLRPAAGGGTGRGATGAAHPGAARAALAPAGESAAAAGRTRGAGIDPGRSVRRGGAGRRPAVPAGGQARPRGSAARPQPHGVPLGAAQPARTRGTDPATGAADAGEAGGDARRIRPVAAARPGGAGAGAGRGPLVAVAGGAASCAGFGRWRRLGLAGLARPLTGRGWWPGRAWRRPAREPPVPVEQVPVPDLDVLPAALATQARRLWREGRPRRALALLYRG